MSDVDLRELRRVFAETQSEEAEISYLRGRLRAGDLSERQLSVTRHFNHAASRRVLGSGGWADSHDFDDWLRALRDQDLEVAIRVALAARAWLRRRVPAEWPAHADTLARLAEAWVCQPSEDSARSLVSARDHFLEHCRASNLDENLPGEAQRVTDCLVERVLVNAVETTAGLADPDLGDELALRFALQATDFARCDYRDSYRRMTYAEAGSRLRRSVAAEVVSWVLGYSDPVRNRVGADNHSRLGR